MSSKINLQTCEYARKSSIFQDNQLIYNKCGQKCGQIKKELDDKTYVLTFNTLAGAGGFAKPRSKQQSAGLLLAAFG